MNYNNIWMMFLLLPIVIGCGTVDRSHTFANMVFISASSYQNELRVQTDENVTSMSSEITVAMAEPEDKDVNVLFRPAPELLERYRLAYYDDQVQLLPDGYCVEGAVTAVISAGNMQSMPVEFHFEGLDRLDWSKSYVWPVTIDSASDMEILESARTMYFVIKEASLVNVVADMSGNRAWPVWDDFTEVSNMQEFTMEALVNGTAFNNESSIHTIMGIEDCFLVRVGDSAIPKNQLQVAVGRIDKEANTTYRYSVSNSSMQLKTDRWYHVAVTFDNGQISVYVDGDLKGTGDCSGGEIQMPSVNFQVAHSEEDEGKPRCFWVGYSYDDDRSFDGLLSEVRMWNRVLSPEEINSDNHFYKVADPEQDESLVAYWKFCDAQGKVVKDYSAYGNDLIAEKDIVWRTVELPVKDNE